MLDADTDNLTKHDFASEATWADKYRDSNHRKDHYEQTQNWHFVDMEIKSPNLDTACFGRAPLPMRSLASNGPAKACAIDKIEQFQAELEPPTLTSRRDHQHPKSPAITLPRCLPRQPATADRLPVSIHKSLKSLVGAPGLEPGTR